MNTCNGIALTTFAQALDPLADFFLDCDGKSQLVATILSLSVIPFYGFSGIVRYAEQCIMPHWWIDLPTATGQCWRIDYSLHQWIHAPQHPIVIGLFDPLDFPYLDYQGVPTQIPVLSKPLFLVTQFDPRHSVCLPYESIGEKPGISNQTASVVGG